MILAAISLGIVCIGPARALGQNQAAVLGHCLSFQLLPMVREDATYGTVTAYFTSYMGTDLLPPQHDVSGANWIFSLEVKPLEGQAGAYMTDYLSFSSKYGLFQYGHLRFTLSSADVDQNGVPDFLQRELGTSFSFTGVQTVLSPIRTSVNVTGVMSRKAGQNVGDFSFNNGIDHPGKWSVPNLAGTLTYSRTDGVPARFRLTGIKPDGSTHAWQAETKAGPTLDRLSFPAFTLTRDDNVAMHIASTFAAQRSGSRYVARFEVADGLASTSWADLTQWVFEINDPTDSNRNGIPDLTDTPLRPGLVAERSTTGSSLRLHLQPAHSYSIWHSADLRSWVAISNILATNATQQLKPTGGSGLGFYRVSQP